MTETQDLDVLLADARAKIASAETDDALRAVERDYLGKEGAVADVLATIPSLEPAQRPQVGKRANEVKQALLAELDARAATLAERQLAAERSGEGFDPSLPGRSAPRGSLHPTTQVRREAEDIFASMGYRVVDGPEVELAYYNFEALNIPEDHPAVEMHDTFWCEGDGLLLRTHTSPVQIRAMEKLDPPFRLIAPGRVFRNEDIDASHEHTFHQIEGMAVGEGISVGHLTGALRGFLREFFRRDIHVRLRPGYFPFVEPGFELDISCPFCSGGCRVCKQSRWIEFCGCGMVHPAVLRAGGVDPERHSGFAFGMGLDRLVMMRYGIDDIRHLMGADLRFMEQF